MALQLGFPVSRLRHLSLATGLVNKCHIATVRGRLPRNPRAILLRLRERGSSELQVVLGHSVAGFWGVRGQCVRCTACASRSNTKRLELNFGNPQKPTWRFMGSYKWYIFYKSPNMGCN